MDTHLRLADGYIEELDIRSAWPSYKQAASWMHNTRVGWSNDKYRELKRGQSVKYAVISRFLDLVLAHPTPEMTHSCAVTLNFARRRGWTASDAPTREVIQPFVTDRQSEDAGDPFRRDWWRRISSLLPHADRAVVGCYDPPGATATSAVATNVRWMLVACGRLVANNPRLCVSESLERAHHIMKIDEAGYIARAAAWQRTNPWTVVFARNGSGLVGQSVMLSVTREFYQAVKEGQVATYDCKPHHIRAKSHYVIIEGAVERPIDLGGGKGHTAIPLMVTILAQISALARCDQLPRSQAVHVLSIAPHALAEDRLRNGGFQFTGQRMARTGVRLMERTLACKPGFDGDFIFRAIMGELGASLDGPPPAP